METRFALLRIYPGLSEMKVYGPFIFVKEEASVAASKETPNVISVKSLAISMASFASDVAS